MVGEDFAVSGKHSSWPINVKKSSFTIFVADWTPDGRIIHRFSFLTERSDTFIIKKRKAKPKI